MPHTFPIRVYYEDTDAAGIVYHANYLRFAERARTEALRMSGFDQSELMRDQGIGFVARRCVCEFLKPARLDDCLTIETRLEDISRVSITMRQIIRRDDDTLVTLEVKLAAVGANMKPARLPKLLCTALSKVFAAD